MEMIIRTRRTRFRHFAYQYRLIRYLIWQGSRLAGWLRRQLLSGRRWLFWLLVLEEAIMIVFLALFGDLDRLARGIVYVFLGWLVQLFALVLVQARKRVVVEQFTDSTGDEQKPDSRGLATLVVGELAEFRDLYSTVDERAIPTTVQKSRPLAATIKVEDVSDFLDSPAMIEAKASVGPVQVPIGALFAFLGRFVRGPRLFGGVHVEEGSLVLAAQLAQQRELKTWRVERHLPATPVNGRLEVPPNMVKELACRMFSDLALGGPVRWKATETFAEALSSIRLCLRTPENRRIRLQEAERSLIDALKEDEQLGYVYYNLGVVFTELRRLAEDEGLDAKSSDDEEGSRCEVEARTHWNAAERAFRRQIRLMPDRWEAYYALALTYKGRRPTPHWDYVLKRCDRVASMKPGRATTAKVWLLKSDANEFKARELLGPGGDLERAQAELALMNENRRMAVAEAWSALCQTARTGRGDIALEAHLAASALKRLAVGLIAEERRLPEDRQREEERKAVHLLGRAVELAPHDAAIRFALGVAAKNSDRARAIREIDEALRIDPTRPKYWSELALLHAASARDGDPGAADHATYCCGQALQLVDCYESETVTALKSVAEAYEDEEPVPETLRRVANAYRQLRGKHILDARRVRSMEDVVVLCKEKKPSRQKLRKLAAGGDNWAAGHASAALGTLDFADGKYKRAKANFKAALDKFDDYPEEILRREVRIQYARALQQLEPPSHDEALEELRRAIGDDPLHSPPREALGDAYCAIHDYKQAESVLRDALRWDPDRPLLHRKLGRCRWKLAQDYRTAVYRKEALLRAVASFRSALDLSEHHKLDVQLVSHYWLARLHKELGEYERAIPYLRRATICVEAQPLIRLLLGEAYIRAHAYDAAETELDFAIENVDMGESDYGKYFEDTGWPPGRVKAYAHTLRGLGYAERGVSPPSGKDPMKHARAALAAAREAKNGDTQSLDAAEAACHFVEGLFALERYATKKRNGLKLAIDSFNRSLGLLPQSETYVGAARACLYNIESGGVSRRRWIERGEEACRNAIELDVTGRFAGQAEALLAEFADARKQPPPSRRRKRRRRPATTPPPQDGAPRLDSAGEPVSVTPEAGGKENGKTPATEMHDQVSDVAAEQQTGRDDSSTS